MPASLPDGNEAVGPGFRVPLFIVSPWVKPGTVFKGRTDHTSVLQFIEQNFSTKHDRIELPTIAKKRRKLDDLREAFDFEQNPITPSLPTAAELYPDASDVVLTLNGENTVVDCTTNLPSWLPSLLGVSSSSPSATATPSSTPRGSSSSTPTASATPSALPTTTLP